MSAEQTYFTILTKTGAAQMALAEVFDVKLPLTHIAIGDGNGLPVMPVENQTTLVNEVWRIPISSKSVDEANPNWLILEAVIPASVGGWHIHEVGVIGGLNPNDIMLSAQQPGNELLAVGNFPPTYKPMLAEGAAKDLVIRLIVAVSNAAVVQLTVDPSVALATHKTVQQAIAAHRTEPDPHSGRYSPLGHVTDNAAHPNIGTPAATPDMLIRRDASARAQIADPAAAADIANKGYIDTAIGTIDLGTPNATPNAIIKRDASARAQIADPAAAADIANKGYIDTAIGTIDLGTPNATANAIIKRDGAGRAQIANPAALGDIASKGYVDNEIGALDLGTPNATANAIIKRDASARAKIASPSVAADIANKGYVDNAIGSMKDYVIDRWSSTSGLNWTWYCKYKSGWVEQGGVVDRGLDARSSTINVNFPVPFADLNYSCIAISERRTGGNNVVITSTYAPTKTSIGLRSYGFNTADLSRFTRWYACGNT